MDRQSIDEADPAAVVAVIFGASEFPRAEVLSASPAFERSATAFAEYLKDERGFHLADDQVLDLFDDEANVIDQNDRLIDHLLSHQTASDLIIYYVGHGGFLPDREYFLALRSTRQGAEGVTGLRIKALAHALEEHFPGKRIFLILDCCFAGEAVAQFQSDGLEDIITNETFEVLPAAGTSLLCAASRNEPAIAPTGATYTMFSDCLLEVLRQGFEDSRKTLSLADIGEVVQKLIKKKFGQGGVRPEVHSPHQDEGDIAKIPLFPNPGYTSPKPKALPPEILEALRNPFPAIRLGAIGPLTQFLASGDAELADLVRAKLEELAAGDDSRSIRRAAREALGQGDLPEVDTELPPKLKPKSKPRPEPKTKPKLEPEGGQGKFRLPLSALAVIAVMVALGLGAIVFWPTPQTPVVGIPQSPPVEEIPQPPPVEETSQSTRDEDIKQLLSEAEQHYRAGRLDSPKSNNAVQRYRAVLALDPENQDAREALDRITTRFVSLVTAAIEENDIEGAKSFLLSAEELAPGDNQVESARAQFEKVMEAEANRKKIKQWIAAAKTAVENGQLSKAEEYMAKVDSIAPGNDEVLALRGRIQSNAAATADLRKVGELLSSAEEDVRKNRLTTPPGNNAVERFRAVLRLDPSNDQALTGLGRVVGKYIQLANRAVAGGDLGRAGGYLAKAEGIGVESSELVAARARLEDEKTRQAKIAQLLAAGETALERDRLDSPVGQNAVEHYRTVLTLDPGNQTAEAGLSRVVDRYLTLGHQAIEKRELDLARDYLAKGEKIQPDSPALPDYRAALQAAATPSALTFAIFPFQSQAVCHYSVRDEVIDAADAIVRKQSKADFTYSYYEAGADVSAIPATSKLWSDNRVRREPKLDAVREAGRRLGVNGVLMVWYKCSHIQQVPVDRYEVEVYLIEVDGDRAFQAKEGFLDADRAISNVFGQFFAAHGIGSG